MIKLQNSLPNTITVGGREFFVKNIDKYVIDGKITTLCNVYKDSLNKTFSKIALDLLKERW